MLLALCSALLGKPLKGGVVVAGGITLGGSIETIHNPVDLVELAMEKGANAVLMPVSSRRAMIDLSDEVATKVQVYFYADAVDALKKALNDQARTPSSFAVSQETRPRVGRERLAQEQTFRFIMQLAHGRVLTV